MKSLLSIILRINIRYQGIIQCLSYLICSLPICFFHSKFSVLQLVQQLLCTQPKLKVNSIPFQLQNIQYSTFCRGQTYKNRWRFPTPTQLKRKRKRWRKSSLPVGLILSRTKVSCSGSFRRISAATGSGCTPCRSPDTLWDRIMLAAIGFCSVLAFRWSGKFWYRFLPSGPC